MASVHFAQDQGARMGLTGAPTSIIPQGVGAPPPPGMDPKRGKLMCIKVRMLDESVGVFHLGHKAFGQALFDEVCRHLNLLECDYFGLEFLDCYGNHCWLDKEKPILRQITASQSDARFYFIVKFYPPNPADLEEEYTRYVFALQIKRDIAAGHFVCNENTAALMVSYIVQSECGDWSAEDYPDHTYLASGRFVPYQTADFLRKVVDHHRKLVGMAPSDSDLALLETARRCDFYGVKFHPAKDIEGTQVNVCVLHLGIRVFHQLTCASTFSWAKIRKLSFKRKKFLIKLHPESYQYYKDTIEFLFETRNECKAFWKKCVEHHAFFRCCDAELGRAGEQGRLFTKGSSFRYFGRTQKQLTDYVREHYKRREPFTRPIHSMSQHSSGSVVVGGSVRTPGHTQQRHAYSSERSLPTPLLPIAKPDLRENGDIRCSQPASPSTGVDAADVNCHPPEPMPPPGTPRLQRKLVNGGDTTAPTSTAALQGSRPGAFPAVSTTDVVIHGECNTSDNYFNRSKMATFAPRPHVVSTTSVVDKRLVRLQSAESSDSSGQTQGAIQRGLPSSTGALATTSASPSYVRRMDLTALASGSRLPKQDTMSGGSQSEKDYYLSGASSSVVLAGHANRHNSTEALTRKKLPTSRAYFMARELLMTERTYVKDLNIVTLHLKEAICGPKTDVVPPPALRFPVLQQLFNLLRPLHDFHLGFLAELEQRITAWELSSRTSFPSPSTPSGSRDSPEPLPVVEDIADTKIGDTLLCAAHNTLEHYSRYAASLTGLLLRLNECRRGGGPLDALLRRFEDRPLCHLPLPDVLLRPVYRPLVWRNILIRLVAFYLENGGDNPDLNDCRVALDKISPITQELREIIDKAENLAKLMELENDLIDVDNLVQSERLFIREGCLQRFSRRGAVQRVFVLFDDCLVYANRTGAATTAPTFKLHGQIPLRGLMLEDGDSFNVAVNLQHCFTIYGGNRSLIVAAESLDEKVLWMNEIRSAVQAAKNRKGIDTIPEVSTLKSSSALDDSMGTAENMRSSFEDIITSGTSYPLSPLNEAKQSASKEEAPTEKASQRSNDTLHVCWHRCTTMGRQDMHRACRNQLSGYLLRKFRNSSGWQKLWVVYGHFALYFYKSHAEDAPLASLPLLGYSVCDPTPEDAILKQNVFKLHYKSHFYFFRADSEYAYQRWVEIIRTACLMPSQSNPSVALTTE